MADASPASIVGSPNHRCIRVTWAGPSNTQKMADSAEPATPCQPLATGPSGSAIVPSNVCAGSSGNPGKLSASARAITSGSAASARICCDEGSSVGAPPGLSLSRSRGSRCSSPCQGPAGARVSARAPPPGRRRRKRTDAMPLAPFSRLPQALPDIPETHRFRRRRRHPGWPLPTTRRPTTATPGPGITARSESRPPPLRAARIGRTARSGPHN